MAFRGSAAARGALGSALVFIAGALLHFAFDWLGAWRPAALLAAVNESVWEHLKIAFWPGLIWAVAERPFVHAPRGAFWAARGVGLACVSIVIVAIFHAYTGLIGHNLLIVDIALFAIAIAVGQAVSATLAAPAARALGLRSAGLLLLAAQIGAFSIFTLHPPALALFQDPRTGLYGLEAHGAAWRSR